MSIIINYTKKDYLAKISELEGYKKMLESHLASMMEYRGQMFDFWDDPAAQKTGIILNSMINRVKFTMDQTEEMLFFYRGAVEKFTGVGSTTDELLEKALGLLSGVGAPKS